MVFTMTGILEKCTNNITNYSSNLKNHEKTSLHSDYISIYVHAV